MSDSQGVTLEQYLERKGGKLAPEWAVRIISAAMEPLARAGYGVGANAMGERGH